LAGPLPCSLLVPATSYLSTSMRRADARTRDKKAESLLVRIRSHDILSNRPRWRGRFQVTAARVWILGQGRAVYDKGSGMQILWAGCKRARDERVETYAWFALLNCASFATSAQPGRGRSVCFNTSRIYCSVVANWAILTVARGEGCPWCW